jgi:hypothetical protein
VAISCRYGEPARPDCFPHGFMNANYTCNCWDKTIYKGPTCKESCVDVRVPHLGVVAWLCSYATASCLAHSVLVWLVLHAPCVCAPPVNHKKGKYSVMFAWPL